jgi:hypothetical protein
MAMWYLLDSIRKFWGLFADNVNLLTNEKDDSALQHKMKNVMNDLETWFLKKI